jgi:hypothetical protein
MLKEVDPEIATEFERSCGQLNAGSFSDSVLNVGGPKFGVDQRSSEDIGSERLRLVALWEHLLENIRQFPKFEHFLRPVPFHRLREAATEGTAVMLNASRDGVDALIFGATDPIKYVPLPNIDIETLTELSNDIVHNRPANTSTSQRKKYTVGT